MRNTEIQCWSSNNGEFLFEGQSFDETLLLQFQSCCEMSYTKNDKWVNLLKNRLKNKEEGEHNDQNVLYAIFTRLISIDYDFAKSLSLFDILDSECFTAKDELGDALIQLCVMADLTFIVTRKKYTSKESIAIDLEVCHCDYDRDCQKALITQSIIN